MRADTNQADPGPGQKRTIDHLVTRLVEMQQCDAKAIERGRRLAEESGQRLDKVLIQLGLVTESGLAAAFSDLLHLPIATADRYPVTALYPDRLGSRFLRRALVVPLAIDDEALVLAVADPLDAFAPAAIAQATGRPVSLAVALPIDLEAVFDRLYPDLNSDSDTSERPNGGDETPLKEDAERLKDLASEAPVIRMVNQIIARAVETLASDIHLEPSPTGLRVRYRYDGLLHEVEPPAPHLIAAVTSRIKIMARLDIAERRLPQDGRIKLAVRGSEVDFRVSTIPSLHGETVVLRILDRSAVAFDYEKLGIATDVSAAFRATLGLPNGIVLITGPTGSGKTTTLYTGLLGLDTVRRKVVTVEDPIEFQLSGVNQIQVKPQIGLNFADLLRSILRQDPDVIMVGEIRDIETAQIAVQAALTGHLVLSTVHTNSAAATITRLRDMGIEDYLMTAVLRGVLAQRLVRRLCPDCKRETAPAPELVERFELDRLARGCPVRLWSPVGCDLCRQTGFRGRQAIAEFLRPDAAIERLIFSRADHNEIERTAVAAGMVPLFEAGLAAALSGKTTIQEVVRSIRTEV